MAAIVFLDIVQPSDRADEVLACVRQRIPEVGYATEKSPDRVEVYFNAPGVDDEQARAALEAALDVCDPDREYVRVVYP